jgi:glycosyltransferase involved in cell wall biosynthesis
MHFAVPSKGRGGIITPTRKILRGATYYVPENEVNDYKYSHGGLVVGVPIEIKGITATRNWILKNCGEKYVIMVDDDVKNAGWVEILKMNNKDRKLLTDEDWIEEATRLAYLCEDLNYKIFGISTHSSKIQFKGYKPFLFQTYVLGSFIGHINDGTYYYDESFQVKEDYELCLRHIKERGGILGGRNLYWECEHWKTNGGCKDYRTQDMEKLAIKKLIQMYPGLIRKVSRKGSEFCIGLEF